jgi:hypothetical protein
MPFSERDWTHLCRVHKVALERFCERVLDEAAAISRGGRDGHDGGRSAHERYLALFRLVHERNAAMAAAFDDLRRSTSLRRLSAMVSLDVVTEEDLAGFQPEVRDAARELRDIFAPRRPPTRRRDPS